MSEQVEMEEDDRGTSTVGTTNQGGEKKRFEVKKFVLLFYIQTNSQYSKLKNIIIQVERRSSLGLGYFLIVHYH